MGWQRITGLVILVLGLAVAALFYVQNSLRVTDLSLNLGFWATQLKEPVSIPLALYLCFGGGALLGAVVTGLGWARDREKIQDLERKLARASLQHGGEPWT